MCLFNPRARLQNQQQAHPLWDALFCFVDVEVVDVAAIADVVGCAVHFLLIITDIVVTVIVAAVVDFCLLWLLLLLLIFGAVAVAIIVVLLLLSSLQ